MGSSWFPSPALDKNLGSLELNINVTTRDFVAFYLFNTSQHNQNRAVPLKPGASNKGLMPKYDFSPYK